MAKTADTDQAAPQTDQARREEAVRRIHALRDRVRARNLDLTAEQAEAIAEELS